MKLHFGCGREILKEYVNIDFIQLPGIDLVVDLETTPYPFEDDSAEEIYGKHLFEHINNFLQLIEEIHRILKPTGRLKIIAPYFAGHGAFNDPTHKRFFGWTTMDYFNENGYYSKAKYRILRKRIFFFSSKKFMQSVWYSIPFDMLINAFPMIYQRFFCYWLPSSEIHYELQPVK